MNLAALRARIRASRDLPILGALVRAADRLWWHRVIRRSGLVDPEFYAAQLGLRRISADRAVWHYVAKGFRRGLSLNPFFDEVYAGGGLPEVFRVPAMYAYLVGERPTISVHPWWDSVGASSADGVPGLERAWSDRSAPLSLCVGERERSLTASALRELAIEAARVWSRRGTHRIDRTVAGSDPNTAVIRFVQARDRRYHLKLAQASRLADSDGVSVSVAMVGVGASQWVSAALLAALQPGFAVQLHPARSAWADVISAELEGVASAPILVVLDARAEFTDAEVEALGAEARRSLAIPAHREIDGTLAGLGAADVMDGRTYRILRGHPAEDAAVIPERLLEVPLATGRTFAVDLDRYRAAGGVRPGDGEELEGLSRHLARSGWPTRVLLDVAPILEEPELAFRSTRLSRGRHGAAVRADRQRAEAIISTAGFDVEGWRVSDTGAPEPMLTWRRPAPGARRWALKICAPPGRQGAVWGDTHFARGLASALRRRGHYVVIDAYGAQNRDTCYLDDVSIVIRGPYRSRPPRHGVSLLWIISHPDEITRGEVQQFDRVFAASEKWSRRAGERWGVRIEPLLEATDTDLFRPAGRPRGSDIVFVGTARGIPRPSVVAPLAAGIPVRVYGPDWRPFIPQAAIAAPMISNTELPERYETASVVLNDQWPAMQREGFIAMRPFDAVAVGGRVISEDVDGIEEIFDGAVVVYRDVEHLLELLRADPDTLFPPDARMAQIAERVRREHSFDARAATLDAAAGATDEASRARR